MGDWEIECRDCGWRGAAAELAETADDSGGSCPDCGGSDFEKQSDTDGAEQN
ncbi:MAG: hypothetical protein P8X85_02140 [Desulfobacterales bacterium]